MLTESRRAATMVAPFDEAAARKRSDGMALGEYEFVEKEEAAQEVTMDTYGSRWKRALWLTKWFVRTASQTFLGDSPRWCVLLLFFVFVFFLFVCLGSSFRFCFFSWSIHLLCWPQKLWLRGCSWLSCVDRSLVDCFCAVFFLGLFFVWLARCSVIHFKRVGCSRWKLLCSA